MPLLPPPMTENEKVREVIAPDQVADQPVPGTAGSWEVL